VRALAVIVGLTACDRAPVAAIETPVVTNELPSWAPLPPATSVIAVPRDWHADARPTVVVFSASWCTSCFASLLSDIALVRKYGDRFQVGVGLVENADVEFERSPMAQLLADVPVWTTDSVKTLAARCGAAAIPAACVVDGDRVVFHGAADSVPRVLDAYGNAAQLATAANDQARAAAILGRGVRAADIPELVRASHSDHGWQNTIAWELATRRDASATDIALAVALAQDVVAADGGVDIAHLDTYNLALSKANLSDDAALVSWRVLAVCSTVHADCMIEKRRAWAFIYYARERGRSRRQ
jgi:hypothetical protein